MTPFLNLLPTRRDREGQKIEPTRRDVHSRVILPPAEGTGTEEDIAGVLSDEETLNSLSFPLNESISN
jgi:hypothetical protein